ncbi:insulinase family protein [Candidatus Hepatincola sp. Pdp]
MLSPKIIQEKNGLTIVLDYLPYINSAILGLWTKTGSRLENLNNNGICHFLEHMVFKGTKNRDSLAISEEIESKGGYMNAYTSKEKTAWYAKVLSSEVGLATDIIFDIIKNPIFPKEELVKEKGVILEEIKMYLDSPQDLAYNLYEKLVYNNHPLAYPVIGNAKNITGFTSDTFFKHIENFYNPKNMVFVISGNFNEEAILSMVRSHNDNWASHDITLDYGKPAFHAQKEVLVKPEIEQTNVFYGLPAVAYTNENYTKLLVTNNILGSGMSSRFFVEIREKRGLAYSVDSFLNSYEDTGTFVVQVGCATEKTLDVINLIKEEITNTLNTVADKEILKAKNQLKSSIIMSLESPYSRCNRMAADILTYRKIKDLKQFITDIENVSKDDVKQELQKLSTAEEAIAVVSNKELSI